jgi:hypothetical protein
MKKSALLRLLLVGAVALTGLFGFVSASFAGDVNDPCQSNNNADADDNSTATATDNNNCSNSGDADAAADQEGTASSGDGVAGQVAGVVSAGDASVDATNRSDDVTVDTGDATGTNTAVVDAFTGSARAVGGDVDDACESDNDADADDDSTATATSNADCSNTGDADAAADQSADAASGDGVGGQVIGVVTSAGGSADLVLDNESTDSNVDTGNGVFDNASAVDSEAITFFAGP